MPQTFSKVCDTFKNHHEDEALKQYVTDLYETLRSQVPRLVETLTRPREGLCECIQVTYKLLLRLRMSKSKWANGS